MKRMLLLSWLLAIASLAFAQSNIPATMDYKKRPTLVIHFAANDFSTADYWRHHSISDVANNLPSANDLNFGPGYSIPAGHHQPH